MPELPAAAAWSVADAFWAGVAVCAIVSLVLNLDTRLRMLEALRAHRAWLRIRSFGRQ